MRGLAITNPGMEDLAALEIQEILSLQETLPLHGQLSEPPKVSLHRPWPQPSQASLQESLHADVNAQCKDGVVLFEVHELLDLCRLAYCGQSLRRVLLLLDSCAIPSDVNDALAAIAARAGSLSFNDMLTPDASFRVVCGIAGRDDLSSQDIEREAGAAIIERIEKERGSPQAVDLAHPDVVVFVSINKNDCYLGVDLAGFDLSKRDYKIFNSATDLNATVAYAILRIAGSDASKKLLDPFCGAGVIPLEAALWHRRSLNHYRKDAFACSRLPQLKGTDFDAFFKGLEREREHAAIIGTDPMLPHVRAAAKNAKIAGVQKDIVFSRVDIEWLDPHFSEHEFDVIVTQLPSSSYQPERAGKLCEGFFYAAAYILKDKGTIATIVRDAARVIPCAAKHGLAVAGQRTIWQGNQRMDVVVFRHASFP